MAKIEFIRDNIVKRPDGTGTKFESGKTYEMHQASADHHRTRGHAKAASDKAKTVDPVEVDAHGLPMEDSIAASEKAADEQKGADARKLAKRSAVKIPDDWKTQSEDQQRSLAVSLSDGQVRNKDEATAAIEAEVKRRADENRGVRQFGPGA
jgi:hypothetical protein